MLKEITIKKDIEQKRKALYDLIYDYLDMNYTFVSIADYQWFVRNIANKNELLDILEYNYLEYESDLFSKVNIDIVYMMDDCLLITEIELIIPKEIDIPKFKAGEKDND